MPGRSASVARLAGIDASSRGQFPLQVNLLDLRGGMREIPSMIRIDRTCNCSVDLSQLCWIAEGDWI